uniref:LicD family protein n=1 Tax=Heterorhabditis bacteriophora TaxID=37862 RepID=A0A1I7WC90_HETBA
MRIIYISVAVVSITCSLLLITHFGASDYIQRPLIVRSYLKLSGVREFPLFDIVYYIENDNYLKFFDDVIRVIPKTEFIQHGNVSVPREIPLFLEYWKRSKLIDCLNINMNRSKTERYLPVEETVQAMSSLTKYLNGFEMYPMLNGGTLLGWYRECSIIPHTKDIDFAIRIEEHKPSLLEDLQKNTTLFKVKRKFGRVDDNYEFTLIPTNSKKPMIDIFWLYSSQKNSWVGGTDRSGSKYRYIYPRYFAKLYLT